MPFGIGRGDELFEVRLPDEPLLVVPPAQAPVPAWPLAAAYQARRAAEDRVSRVEPEDLAAELGPDRGHQRGEKAWACGRLPGCLPGRGAHRASSKTDAKIRTRTSPRLPEACSRVVPPTPGHSR